MPAALARALYLLLLCAAGAGCEPAGPRALILVDATSEASRPQLAARVAAFERASGRRVRALPVQAGSEAVALASRGDADVAVVDEAAPVDGFVASGHGREAGRADLGGARCRVIAVSSAQHPKVDGPGAEALARAIADAP